MKETDEIFSTRKSRFPKIKAKVVLCRCNAVPGKLKENLFGMRIEERKRDWVRTWAFKISETKARHEKWDIERFSGSLTAVPEYNGCPYCGSLSLAQCPCGKMFCYGNKNYGNKREIELKCPWCNRIALYRTAEVFDIQGEGF